MWLHYVHPLVDKAKCLKKKLASYDGIGLCLVHMWNTIMWLSHSYEEKVKFQSTPLWMKF